jgi:hypothetical protein
MKKIPVYVNPAILHDLVVVAPDRRQQLPLFAGVTPEDSWTRCALPPMRVRRPERFDELRGRRGNRNLPPRLASNQSPTWLSPHFRSFLTRQAHPLRAQGPIGYRRHSTHVKGAAAGTHGVTRNGALVARRLVGRAIRLAALGTPRGMQRWFLVRLYAVHGLFHAKCTRRSGGCEHVATDFLPNRKIAAEVGHTGCCWSDPWIGRLALQFESGPDRSPGEAAAWTARL